MQIKQILKHGPGKDVARFAKKIAPNERDCWLWTGTMTEGGYGKFKLKGKYWRAHRLAYLWATGILPTVLDHIVCDTPRCVNPQHVEPSSPRANVLRGNGPTAMNAKKLYCKNGHLLPPPNKMGWRPCSACRKRSPQTPEQRREHARKEAQRGAELRSANTHCKRGHAYTDENTIYVRAGSRACRQCKLERDRNRYALTHPSSPVLRSATLKGKRR